MKHLKEVCGTSDKLAVILQGGEVIRYHAEGKQLDNQLVSDHTWRVMVILLHLFPGASRELILTALYHDVAECYTGDISAPLKRSSPEVSKSLHKMQDDFHKHFDIPAEINLTVQDFVSLKVADMLEAYITSSQQNTRYAQVVAGRALEYAMDHAQGLPKDVQRKIKKIVFVFRQYHHIGE